MKTLVHYSCSLFMELILRIFDMINFDVINSLCNCANVNVLFLQFNIILFYIIVESLLL